MKNITLLSAVLVILLLALSGCIGTPAGTPTATPTQTAAPTVIPATPTATPAAPTPVKYQVWVDSDYGFQKVRAFRGDVYIPLPSTFNVLNFTVNAGDTVRWINKDDYENRLTVVSIDGLWANQTGFLSYFDKSFEYTFNRTGTYTFFIEEFRRLPRQKITVKME